MMIKLLSVQTPRACLQARISEVSSRLLVQAFMCLPTQSSACVQSIPHLCLQVKPAGHFAAQMVVKRWPASEHTRLTT